MKILLIIFVIVLPLSSGQASNFIPNEKMNEKTIEALLEAGSDPQKPHPIEHHFYCCLQHLFDQTRTNSQNNVC